MGKCACNNETVKTQEEDLKCYFCGSELNYGYFDIHSCFLGGKIVDLCTDCWSEHTTDEDNQANIIISIPYDFKLENKISSI